MIFIFLFSSLVELPPTVLLYKDIYFQVFSPFMHRHRNCSLALLTSICYLFLIALPRHAPTSSPLLDHPAAPAGHHSASSASISNFSCSHPLSRALLQVFPPLLNFHRTLVVKQQHLHQLIESSLTPCLALICLNPLHCLRKWSNVSSSHSPHRGHSTSPP